MLPVVHAAVSVSSRGCVLCGVGGMEGGCVSVSHT